MIFWLIPFAHETWASSTVSSTIHFRFQCPLAGQQSYSFHFFIFFDYAVTVSKFSELFSYAATVFFPELVLHTYSGERYCNLDRMISGGWILWNAGTICEMSKILLADGKSQNKDCWDWRIKKLDASEIYPTRLNAKEVLITQKDGELEFPVADGSANLSGTDYEFQEPTLRWESTVRRANLIGESHGDREEFQPEETKHDKGIIKHFWAHAEARKNFISRHHIEPRSSTCVPRKSFLISRIYIIERNSSVKKYTMRAEDWRKAKTSEAKTNSIILILQGRTEFCTLVQLYARIRPDEKISRKLFT